MHNNAIVWENLRVASVSPHCGVMFHESMNILKVKIELREGLSTESQNCFWDRFIEEAIESNNLQYGGLSEGCAESVGNFEISNKHQKLVSSWLEKRSEVEWHNVELYADET